MLGNIKKVTFLNAKANLIYFCTSHCIRRFARKHEQRLVHQDKVAAIELLDTSESQRRLNRKRTISVGIMTIKVRT